MKEVDELKKIQSWAKGYVDRALKQEKCFNATAAQKILFDYQADFISSSEWQAATDELARRMRNE